MDILLEELHYTDAKKLYQFELENRIFFESMVPSRGDDYYNFETFKKKHEVLLSEQVQRISYYHLIKDKTGSILGRMNLVDIDESQSLGHLGYRMGQRRIT